MPLEVRQRAEGAALDQTKGAIGNLEEKGKNYLLEYQTMSFQKAGTSL